MRTRIVLNKQDKTIKIVNRNTNIRLAHSGRVGPTGAIGPAGTITIGNTTTLDPGLDATVVNTGTLTEAVLDFGIPEGIQGEVGPVPLAIQPEPPQELDFLWVDTDDDSSDVNTTIEETQEELAAHIADLTNPHEVTKLQVGLGNVDDTSDVNKPVSNATQSALELRVPIADTSVNPTNNSVVRRDSAGRVFTNTPTINTHSATKEYVDQSIASLIDSSPGTLDTLNELAAALGDDPNFSGTMTTLIGTKADQNYVDDRFLDTYTKDEVDNKESLLVSDYESLISLKRDLVSGTQRVYTTDGSNAQSSLPYTQSATAASIVYRTTGGVASFGTPTADAHAATKLYVDNADSLKLDRISTAYRVYGTDTLGANSPLTWSWSADPDTLARRGSGGVITTATPTANTHATTKLYVDTGDALQVTKAGDTMTGLLANTYSAALAYNQTRGGVTNSWGTSTNGRFAVVANGTTALSINPTGISLGTNADDAAPTHTITLRSTATGLADYKTADQVTNYERARFYWDTAASVYYIGMEKGGTGTYRSMRISNVAGRLDINATSVGTPGVFNFGGTVGGSSTNNFVVVAPTLSQSTGSVNVNSISPVINQSGTAAYTALLINPTETATGSGAKLLIDAQVGGISRFRVDNTGRITTPSIVVSFTEPTSPAVGDIWLST